VGLEHSTRGSEPIVAGCRRYRVGASGCRAPVEEAVRMPGRVFPSGEIATSTTMLSATSPRLLTPTTLVVLSRRLHRTIRLVAARCQRR
jgi:hypothetical protein